MRLVTVFVLIGVLLLAAVPAAAQTEEVNPQNANEPVQVIVNYAEIDDAAQQILDVYFTLVDGSNRAISAPTVDAVYAVFNNTLYTGIVSIPQTPLHLSLVLDASGSMEPAADLMRRAAIEAVNTAPQGTRFSVIQFNEAILTKIGFTDDRSQVIAAINSIGLDQFDGGTCLYDATFDALEAIQAAAPAGRRAVILFTDGRDELVAGGALDPCSTRSDYARVVETARNPQVRVPVYTIGLSGTQVINQEELANLALSTGGLSAFGAETELSRLFLQIIQALAAQRQATFSICVPAGEYGGLFNIEVENGNLNAPISSLSFTTTCVIPTDTPTPTATFTPEPLVVRVSNFRFNSETNSIEFEISRRGFGDVGEYRVEIINKTSGFRVPGEFGLLIVPANGTGVVSVPLDRVSAPEWIVVARAYDSAGALLSESAPAEIAPERTAVPTPIPTDTPTATATLTPSPTPLVPQLEFSSLQFLPTSNEFILNLGLTNITPDNASSYTIRVENAAGIQVASETRVTLPTNRITFPAVDTENRPLPPGQYTIWVEIPVANSPTPLRADREVEVPAPPPSPTPTPMPSPTEQLVTNISSNPVLAIGFVLFVVLALALVVLLIRRASGRRRDYRQRVFQESFNPAAGAAAPDPHTEVQDVSAGELGSDGITLRVVTSPHFAVGKEWSFSSAAVTQGLRIGKASNQNAAVNVDLDDPGVSKLHATLYFEDGRYWIRDEGSTNGTYVDEQPLTRGQRFLLHTGQTIRFGRNTQLTFEVRAEAVQNVPPVPVLPPASDLPSGISARLTIVQSPDPNLQAGRTFEIRTRDFSIGRGAANDLTINAEGVSKTHATIKWVNNQFVITDQRSTNYTTVDGERLQALSPKMLQQGKEYDILLGQKTRLQFSYHAIHQSEARTSMERETQRVPLPPDEEQHPEPAGADVTATFVNVEELPENVTAEVSLLDDAGEVTSTQPVTLTEITMGRKATNTLVIDHPEVSRMHALLLWRDGAFHVEDLGSGNGTFVDGYRLNRNEPARLTPDEVHLVRLGRERAAVYFRFHYSVKLPPSARGDEDEPTEVPEE